MNAVHHRPWWAQLLTGIVLIAGCGTVETINQYLHDDSPTLTILGFLLGLAGTLVLLAWLG